MKTTNNQRKKSIQGVVNHPADKILKISRLLFYSQGYNNTGINQIIQESGTSKKSFYRYFRTKDELAKAYLKAEKKDFLQLFQRLQGKSRDFDAFVRTWCFILRKEADCGRYHGCPFGNFVCQSSNNKDFQDQLKEVILDWREILADQLLNGNPSFPSDKIEPTIDKILMLYQGAVQLWKISGESDYFEKLELELLRIGEKYTRKNR